MDLLRENDFRAVVDHASCAEYIGVLRARYGDDYDAFVQMLFGDSWARKHAISCMVGYFVHHCCIGTVDLLSEPLVRYRAEMREEARVFLDTLTTLVRERVIFSAEVQHLEFKGQQMVVAVFEALQSDPEKFLPRDTRLIFEREKGSLRVICDHVAGMTDAFLLRTYERLYSPRMGSVFDKL